MKQGGKRTLWIAITLAGLAIAAGAAIAIGSGDSSSDEPFSYSVEEARKPCSGGVFLPPHVAEEFLERPPPEDWSVVQDHPRAVFANSGIVEIHLSPGAEEQVTFEGIDFQLRKEQRPEGTVLYPPCSRGPRGKIISANFDSPKPKVEVALSLREEVIDIGFPWTIPLEEPATVLLIPGTSRCHCDWRATIPWRSGSERGKIVVDDGGKDFELTYTGGLNVHFSVGGDWS